MSSLPWHHGTCQWASTLRRVSLPRLFSHSIIPGLHYLSSSSYVMRSPSRVGPPSSAFSPPSPICLARVSSLSPASPCFSPPRHPTVPHPHLDHPPCPYLPCPGHCDCALAIVSHALRLYTGLYHLRHCLLAQPFSVPPPPTNRLHAATCKVATPPSPTSATASPLRRFSPPSPSSPSHHV
ncbi:hypothetical protein EDB83DRAFT_1446411 [Lactarius deliciosus]|nr:hypothetical protein EDB83DRAFT_1446411 [Lactarius deliciosus]